MSIARSYVPRLIGMICDDDGGDDDADGGNNVYYYHNDDDFNDYMKALTGLLSVSLIQSLQLWKLLHCFLLLGLQFSAADDHIII